MNYKEMKVTELKEETKKRGLPVSTHSHKFTKQELMDQLIENDISKQISNIDSEETKEVKQKKDNTYVVYGSDGKMYHARKSKLTLEKILETFGKRKPQCVYDKELHVGSWIIFLHYFETKDQVLVKKLRRAEVIEVDRSKETVIVRLPLGSEISLCFDDLLYIVGKKGDRYPRDLDDYINYQNRRFHNEKR